MYLSIDIVNVGLLLLFLTIFTGWNTLASYLIDEVWDKKTINNYVFVNLVLCLISFGILIGYYV